jgi:hypothetical protein
MHGKRRVSARRGRAGEKSDFFSILPGNPRQLCPDDQLPPPIWRGLLPPSCGMVEILGCGILSLSRGGQRNREELLRRHR